MKTHKAILAATALAATAALLPNEASAQTRYETPLNPTETLAVSIGYINKDWVTECDGKTYHENFWGEPDKRLHGMQIGVTYQPCLNFGLGLRTGLFLELCTSESDYVKEKGWDSYNETSLYLPLHLAWRIPVGPRSSITPFAGLGFNWAMYGSFEDDWRYDYYYDDYGYGPSEWQHFGEGGAPKRWNNQLEFGVDVNLSGFQIGFTYSKGIRDHELYDGLETYQNKIAINLGFCMDL